MPPGLVGAHGLDRVQHHRGLPVALAAEAVTLGHQPLHRQPGKLAEATQILEVRGEGAEATLGEEGAQPGLDPGAVTQRLMSITAGRQFRHHLVELGVLLHQLVDFGVGDVIHRRDKIIDAVGVHRDPEAHLGIDLVALGDRHIAHVVAEPRKLQPPDCGRARAPPAARRRCARPRRVGDMPDHGLAGNAQPGLDVAELPVTVRSLVEVHEVHVDLGPWQRHVGLGVQMQQRLLQRIQPGDPHLRGENVCIHAITPTQFGVGVRVQHRSDGWLRLSVSTGCHSTGSGSCPDSLS